MFDLTSIIEKITDKIKPALEEGKKQAEFSLLVNVATQMYCAEHMRGCGTTIESVTFKAKNFIKTIKENENVK